MKLSFENEINSIIGEYQYAIENNKNIIPSLYDEDYFTNMVNNLADKKYDNLDEMRIDLLKEFGSFINTYNIDIRDIDKKILDEIYR